MTISSDCVLSNMAIIGMLTRTPKIRAERKVNVFYEKKHSITEYNICSLYIATNVPSRHKTLNQCFLKVGPPSTTLSQH